MLPKIIVPEYDTVLPISQKKIRYRPFLAKEQKILLMAIESNDPQTILQSISQIVQSCILTQGISVENMSSIDLEHMFICLRKKSVGERLEVQFKPQCGCDTAVKIMVDLDKVVLVKPPDYTNKIMMTDTVGLVMKHPSAHMMSELIGNKKGGIDSIYRLLAMCVESVFDAENNITEFTSQELEIWLGLLTQNQIEKIFHFLTNLPYHSMKMEYKCPKCQKPGTYEAKSITDFFS